jgi:mannose-1-phosphate guanylyltransferase
MRQRWAVILAGTKGSGLRLLDELVLVEETVAPRTEPPDHVRTLLLQDTTKRQTFHEAARESQPSPAAGAGGTADQGAAFGMAFALGRIRRVDRYAVVGFYPSIEGLADAEKFNRAISFAYQVAARNRTRLILVGAAPIDPDADSGHDNQGSPPDPAVPGHQAFIVNQFARYPRAVMTGPMSTRPGPWKVAVTVGTVDAFLAAFLAIQPSLTVMADAIASARRGERDSQAVEAAFARLPRAISCGVSALAPQRCLVVPLVADQPSPSSR